MRTYPGWQALVDGRRASVHSANLLGKAVPFPPGAKQIEVFFQSQSVRLGGLLSAVSLLVTLLLCIASAARGVGLRRT